MSSDAQTQFNTASGRISILETKTTAQSYDSPTTTTNFNNRVSITSGSLDFYATTASNIITFYNNDPYPLPVGLIYTSILDLYVNIIASYANPVGIKLKTFNSSASIVLDTNWVNITNEAQIYDLVVSNNLDVNNIGASGVIATNKIW